MPLSNILRQTVSIAVMLTVSQLISCAYGQQTTNAAARTLSPEVAVNGCGSGKFIINKGLRAVGESVLIDCCNQHDVCYGSCKQRSLCDYEFNQCLSDECQKLPLIRRKICEMDKIGLYSYFVLSMRKYRQHRLLCCCV